MKAPGDTTFFVARSVIVADTDIEEARTARTPGGLLVTVRLTPRAAARFADVTTRHIGGRLAVLIDGRLKIAPLIVMPMHVNAHRAIELGLQLPGADADSLASAVATRWHSRP